MQTRDLRACTRCGCLVKTGHMASIRKSGTRFVCHDCNKEIESEQNKQWVIFFIMLIVVLIFFCATGQNA